MGCFHHWVFPFAKQRRILTDKILSDSVCVVAKVMIHVYCLLGKSLVSAIYWWIYARMIPQQPLDMLSFQILCNIIETKNHEQRKRGHMSYSVLSHIHPPISWRRTSERESVWPKASARFHYGLQKPHKGNLGFFPVCAIVSKETRLLLKAKPKKGYLFKLCIIYKMYPRCIGYFLWIDLNTALF